MQQIKRGEAFPSRQFSKKVVNTGQGVYLSLCKLANCLLEVPTNPDRAILFDDWDYRCSQCENLVGVMIPAASSLSNSAETLSHRAKETCLALKNCGFASSFR